MALIATPALQIQIESLSNDFIHALFSGDGVTEDNFTTDPLERRTKACAKFASDLSSAIETWLLNTILQVPPGGVVTAGAPTSHVSISPSIVLKS